MSLSTEALTVLVVLLPGFVCAKIVQWLCVRPEQTELDKVVEALLYSFLIYVTYSGLLRKPVSQLDSVGLLWLTSIAVGWAVGVSALWTNDTLGWVLRKAKVTHRTSRPSVWLDTFHHYGGYVLVELKDGRSLLGWIRYYSDLPDAPSVFLEDAAWVLPTGKQLPIPGAGILIASDCGIKTISFHHPIDTRVPKVEEANAKAAGA